MAGYANDARAADLEAAAGRLGGAAPRIEEVGSVWPAADDVELPR